MIRGQTVSMKHVIWQHRSKLKELYRAAQIEFEAGLRYRDRASLMREHCLIFREKLRRNSSKFAPTASSAPRVNSGRLAHHLTFCLIH